MTKWSRWGVWSVCVAMIGALGCYDSDGRGDVDASRVDASRSDAPTGPPTLPEQCNLAWLRTIPVDATELGFVISIATDRDENVLVSFFIGGGFTLDGVGYPGGDYLMGLDRENRLQVRPTARAVRLTSTEGRILGAVYGLGGMTSVVELDGRTGETLRDFGAFRAEEFWEPEATFVGETLVWSMTVAGEFAFPGEPLRVLPRGTGIVLAIRPGGWRGVAEWEGRVPMTASPDGALLMGAPGPLCFNGVCQDVRSMRRLVHEDGSVTGVPEARVDREAFAAQLRTLSDGSLMTLGSWPARWRADGELRWTHDYEPWAFFVNGWGVEERAGRVVTMIHVADTPTAMLGGLGLALGAVTQDVFVDFSLTDGTPLRWWHIENPDGAGRSGATWYVMGASGRSYATGIADPIVDVCGMRVTDGLFFAAFD